MECKSLGRYIRRYGFSFCGNPLTRQRDVSLTMDQVLGYHKTKVIILHQERILMIIGNKEKEPKFRISWQNKDTLEKLKFNFNSNAILLGTGNVHQATQGIEAPQEIDFGGDLEMENKDKQVDQYSKTSYIAVDASSVNQNDIIGSAKSCSSDFTSQNLEFRSIRSLITSCDGQDVSIIAQAKALMDWNHCCQYCSVCGNRTVVVELGVKRICSKCSTNFYPRTDPVVICCVISKDYQRMLLGRYHRSPPGMYTTLAGFVDQGESIEEAVEREIWEESGIHVDDVIYHASQPFPLGPGRTNQLMIGCIAIAKNGSENIVVDKAEMEDIRWFERMEVELGIQETFSSKSLWFPPKQFIAHHLIQEGIKLLKTNSHL